MSTITERVNKIVADKLVIDESQVTAHANFKQDLGAESIDLVELIVVFEREFSISISDQEVEKIVTVAGAINSVTNHYSLN
jgi:acyl carrier protein